MFLFQGCVGQATPAVSYPLFLPASVSKVLTTLLRNWCPSSRRQRSHTEGKVLLSLFCAIKLKLQTCLGKLRQIVLRNVNHTMAVIVLPLKRSFFLFFKKSCSTSFAVFQNNRTSSADCLQWKGEVENYRRDGAKGGKQTRVCVYTSCQMRLTQCLALRILAMNFVKTGYSKGSV